MPWPRCYFRGWFWLWALIAFNASAASRLPFATLSEAFDGPVSRYFGVNADGSARNTNSYYRATTPGLIFDTANQRAFASLTREGLVESVCTLDDSGCFRGSSPWPFALQIGDRVIRLEALRGSRCELLGNFFPLQTFSSSNLVVRQLVFAPAATNLNPLKPRAVILAFRIENRGPAPLALVFKGPSTVVDWGTATAENSRARPVPAEYPPRWPEQSAAKGRFAPAHEALLLLDGSVWDAGTHGITLTLNAGESRMISLAGLVGGSLADLQTAAAEVRTRSALEWLNQTWSVWARRLGDLEIPEDPFYAELFQRLAIEACQSVMISDNLAHGNDDGAHLLTAFLDPSLLRDYVRSAGAPPISTPGQHSVYTAFYGLPVAGAEYYQMTGDAAFFREHPELWSSVTNGFADLFQFGRRSPPMLFYADRIWDSLARGDWHFGSNLYLWYCFQRWSQIARTAYADESTAVRLNQIAGQMHSDINTFLAGPGPLGLQFYEGAYTNGVFERGHDGEEGASGMAPFYGFCRADEPKLLRYKQRAFSADNPIYNAPLESIDWLSNTEHHEQPWSGWRSGPTSPAWVTGLAGAESEADVAHWLQRMGQITDLDGSVWWWPYQLTNTVNLTDVRRSDADALVGKVGYTASMFGAAFYFKVVGLTFDAPARTLEFAPLCPWNAVRWTGCRLGNSRFDLALDRQSNFMRAILVNRNAETFAGTIRLPVPAGARVTGCELNGQPVTAGTGTAYDREVRWVTVPLRPGGTNVFTVRYSAAAELLANPGFEAGAEGWQDWGHAYGIRHPLRAHTGEGCLLVQGQGGWSQNLTRAVAPGRTYRLSGFGKLSVPGGTGYIGLRCWDATGKKLQEAALSFQRELCYARKSLDLTVPPQTARGEVFVWREAGGAADFYADDLSLIRLD